jgi:CRP-like cAMP-binding protein
MKNLLELGLLDDNGSPLICHDELAELLAYCTPLSLRAGTVLCRQGEAGNVAWLIMEGLIRVIRTFNNGATKYFEFGPGSILGEMSLVTGLPRTATLELMNDAELFELSSEAYLKLVTTNPRIMKAFAKIIVNRNTNKKTAISYLQYLREMDLRSVLDVRRIIWPLVERISGMMEAGVGTVPDLPDLNDIIDVLHESQLIRRILVSPDGKPLVSREDLDIVARNCTHRKLQKGQYLCHQGDTADNAYVLSRGTLGGDIRRDDGHHLTFEIVRGALIGEISLLTGRTRTASIQAIDNAELVEISPEAFVHLLALGPDIPKKLAQTVADQLVEGARMDFGHTALVDRNGAALLTDEEQELLKDDCTLRHVRKGEIL